MKKSYLHTPIYFLFIASIFIIACNERNQPSTQRGNPISPFNPNIILSPADQIAEYVVEVFEDKNGYLWFGTMANGAARYDGKTLTYFTTTEGLCGNTVSSFAEDKDGNLWFGTHTGLCKYDGQTFTTLRKTTGKHDEGEGWMGVQSDSKGNIWTSSSYGVSRYDGTSFTEFKAPIVKENITSYSITPGKFGLDLEDSNGNLWFGTDGYGALKYDGKSFTRFTQKDGLPSNNVISILEDKRGHIWFTCVQSSQPTMTGDGGLGRYDGKTFTTFSDIKGLSENDIYTIYEDKKRNVWIGAMGTGIYRYDGENFTLFNDSDRKDLITRFALQGILEDSRGIMWCGFSGGLFRFDGKRFINVTKGGPWD